MDIQLMSGLLQGTARTQELLPTRCHVTPEIPAGRRFPLQLGHRGHPDAETLQIASLQAKPIGEGGHRLTVNGPRRTGRRRHCVGYQLSALPSLVFSDVTKTLRRCEDARSIPCRYVDKAGQSRVRVELKWRIERP